MKKYQHRLLIGIGIMLTAVSLVACGKTTSHSAAEASQTSSSRKNDMSDAITEFVRSTAFQQYNANVAAFTKAGVKGIFQYSNLKTKKTGQHTYVTTISGEAYPKRKDSYANYLQLKITAQGTKAEPDEINKAGFTSHSAYNKWFTITEIKKLKAYDKVAALNDSASGLDLGTSVTIDGKTTLVNSSYAKIKDLFPISDANEFATGMPVNSNSGIVSSIQNLLATNDVNQLKAMIPENTYNGLVAGLQSLDQGVLSQAPYFAVARISKTYYAAMGLANADDNDPYYLLIFQDPDVKDTDLKQLVFVQAIKVK